MAFPTYVNKGTFAHQATGTPLNVGLPSGWAQDDILIITFLHANPGSAVPSGWTRIGTEQDFGARSLSVFAKRAGASESTVGLTLTGGGSVGNACAQMEAYRGCITTGTAWEAAASGQDGTVEVAFTSQSVTTLGLDRLVHVSGGQAGDIGGQRWSNWAGTNLANVTERVDDGFTDGTGGSIATAHGERATAGSCSFSADKDGSRADANVVLALIPATPSSTFTADGTLLKTQSSSFTANAVLLKNQSASLTAEAVLAVGTTTIEGSFTANAVVLRSQASAVAADATLKRPDQPGSFLADAVLLRSMAGSFSADSVLVFTPIASFSADAVLKREQSGSLASDADLFVTASGSFAADAVVVTGTVSGSFSADAILLRAISGSMSADAVLSATLSGLLAASAILRVSQAGAFAADAVLLRSGAGSLIADAVLLKTLSGSAFADAILKASQSGSLSADAVLIQSFTADAVLKREQSGSLTTDGVVILPNAFTADAVLVATSRFYLSASLAPPANPSFAGGWESTGSALRRMMGRPSLAASTKANNGVAETSTSDTFDVLNYQFVSEPLAYAGVVCGPLGGFIRATESSGSADDRSQMVVKVVSGDGSTLIGTVLDFDASALTDEWPTTSASRRFPLAFSGTGTKGTPVSFSAGDRIVVEVGYRAHNTSATSFTGTLRAGHTVGGTDFTATAQTADNNPWIDIRATTRLLPTDGTFTANAILRRVQTGTPTADAYIRPPYQIQHARTGPHTGFDETTDHTIAHLFDRYLRGDTLHDVLVDFDARLTARERHLVSQWYRFSANAILRGTPAGSLPANAYLVKLIGGSFTANAFFNFAARAFIVDPSIFISDSIAGAVDWGISTAAKGAFKGTASLTSEAGDPEDFWGETDKTGWAKFTLASPATVRVSTDYTGGDSVIILYGPGSPTDANLIDFADDTDDGLNPESLYPFSESITVALAAGTYYVEVFPFDPTDTDFNIMLTMQIV